MKSADRQRIMKLVRAQGWRIRKGKGGHGIVVLPPGGRAIAIRTHGTGGLSDERDVVAALRRAGLRWVQDGGDHGVGGR